jgi:hypothetical protein
VPHPRPVWAAKEREREEEGAEEPKNENQVILCFLSVFFYFMKIEHEILK